VAPNTGTDEIAQLVLSERQGRDRGWWEQMAACYHPQSSVFVSWFRGTGPDFVTTSRTRVASGKSPVHRLSPPVVHRTGARAVVEVPAAIEFRTAIDGVEVDHVAYTRLLFRVERHVRGWLIDDLTGIYERDTLAPVHPGAELNLDVERLAVGRSSYRYLSYLSDLGGARTRDDLYGDDRPEQVAELYSTASAWCADATSTSAGAEDE
jgi:SnoaL-like domain